MSDDEPQRSPDEEAATWVDEMEANREMLKRRHDEMQKHPYRDMEADIISCGMMLSDVFSGNLAELLAVLDEPAADSDFAFEIVQNARRSERVEEYEGLLARRMHNYFASIQSLTETFRMSWKHRGHRRGNGPDAVDDEFTRRKLSVEPVVQFAMDLRRYAQHYGRFPLAVVNEINVVMNQSATVSFDHRIRLSASALLEWHDWNPTARKYLEETEEIVLRDVLGAHSAHYFSVIRWALEELIADAEPFRESFNELLAQHEAEFFGISIEEARERLEENTNRWQEGYAFGMPPSPDTTMGE